MKKLWSELPNAHHIDWVLDSLESRPYIWIQTFKKPRIEDFSPFYYQAWDQARGQVYIQDRDHAYRQAWIHARDQVWKQTRGPVYNLILGVLIALIAYDDSEKYLCMTYNELKAWSLISENPQAILLLPLVYVKEQLNECLV